MYVYGNSGTTRPPLPSCTCAAAGLISTRRRCGELRVDFWKFTNSRSWCPVPVVFTFLKDPWVFVTHYHVFVVRRPYDRNVVCICLLFQYSAKVKLTPVFNDSVHQMLLRNEIKFRKHPGKCCITVRPLSDNLVDSIVNTLKGWSRKDVKFSLVVSVHKRFPILLL